VVHRDVRTFNAGTERRRVHLYLQVLPNLRPMQVPLEFDGRDSPMMSGTRAVSLLTGAC
jgi:hypothetical protein